MVDSSSSTQILLSSVRELSENDTPLVEKPFLFADVLERDWFYSDVKTMFNRGVIGGMTERNLLFLSTFTAPQTLPEVFRSVAVTVLP